MPVPYYRFTSSIVGRTLLCGHCRRALERGRAAGGGSIHASLDHDDAHDDRRDDDDGGTRAVRITRGGQYKLHCTKLLSAVNHKSARGHEGE